MSSVSIQSAWLIPSPDLNRIAYRHTAGDREILEFRGDPLRDDRYSGFRVPPLEIGPRLLTMIDSLQEHIPLHAIGGAAGLMLAGRRPGER
jgi:hypothetical protein